MPVNTEHDLYVKRSSQWRVVRDCIEGEDAVKSKGEVYLPRPKGYDKNRYNAYKLRAEWVNYTRRVLTGLHGLVFRKRPTITCPAELRPLLNNIDRKGSSIYRFASEVFKDSLPVSFGGLLDDMPEVNGQLSLKEAEDLGITPYMRYYSAENIINWKFDVINGKKQLSLVVLRETYEEENEDEFIHDKKIQYRVLDIKNGIYRQRVFKPTGKDDEFIAKEISVSINGKPEKEIPFYPLFEAEPGVPFFLDLARANISHYRKSADYENGVHLTTIPTAYVTGHEQAVDEETGEKETVGLGEDIFLFIPEADAKVGILNFAGEGLTHNEKALETSASNMAILGSRLVVSEKGTTESADSAKIHRAGENASLADLARLVADAFTSALKTIAQWKGFDDDSINVEFCTDYDTLAFDANALNAITNLSEAGKMPMPYVFDILKNGEYTPVSATLEEYATLLDMESKGYSPSEIVQQYNAIRQGKRISLTNKVFENNTDKNNDNNTENEEEQAS